MSSFINSIWGASRELKKIDIPTVLQGGGDVKKNAERGTLESDLDLVRKAPHLDWGSILSEKLPGFKEWYEKENPVAGAESYLSSEEDILRKLDWDL
jgi:hypothetical protein